MAKGAVAKEQIFQKMLEMFNGSFMYNGGKELRIPWDENGEEVQIKVALTCAKENVYPDNAPREIAAALSQGPVIGSLAETKPENVEPTEEEKKNLEDLMAALGL